MRSVIKGGGKRHVSSNSKFSGLATDLASHGALELEHYYRDGKRGTAVYSVTEMGKQEFGSES